MDISNMHREVGEVWMCGTGNMIADRQRDPQRDPQTQTDTRMGRSKSIGLCHSQNNCSLQYVDEIKIII